MISVHLWPRVYSCSLQEELQHRSLAVLPAFFGKIACLVPYRYILLTFRITDNYTINRTTEPLSSAGGRHTHRVPDLPPHQSQSMEY